jgi:DNA (cytosine-5)-methyltransferase 1
MTKPPYRVPLMSEIAKLPWNGRKVVSTFSGCGGSSLGYKMAGFRVLWASEFIPAAQETYAANHPKTILDTRDIREVKPQDILDATGLGIGEIDLFDGSPPCASFSTAGIREEGWGKVKKYSDTKQRTDDLFFEFVRLIEGTQPKTFVAENVKGLTVGVATKMLGSFQQDMFDSQDETILHKLINAGYRVGYRVLDAANLGVPQHRNRIIFVGIRRDLANEHQLQPAWPKALGYQYSVRDAVPWISRIYDGKDSSVAADEDASGTILASDGGRSSSSFDQGLGYVEAEADISKYCTGREWDNLKVGEQSTKYFSEVKVDPDGPSPTICASHGSGGIASTVHPYEKRKFSIAELKRICGFPDDFQLTGTFAQKWERLGRAVPPVMMMHVAKTVFRDILCKIPKN